MAFAEETRTHAAQEADALFREARDRLTAGQLTEACPLFEKSIQLEPAIGAFLNLGRCYELTSRPASAIVSYAEAARRAREIDDVTRASIAEKHLDQLHETVPRLVLLLPEHEPIESIFLDDHRVERDLWAKAVPVDPGRHEIRVAWLGETSAQAFEVQVPEAKGVQPPVHVSLVVSRRRSSSRPETLDPVTPDGTRVSPPELAQAAAATPRSNGHRPIRTAAWVGLSVGSIAAVSGVALGIDAAMRAAGSDCDSDLECSPEGLETRGSAREELIAGYAVGISGAVIAALSGVVLVRSAPQGTQMVRADLSAARNGVRLGLRYRF